MRPRIFGGDRKKYEITVVFKGGFASSFISDECKWKWNENGRLTRFKSGTILAGHIRWLDPNEIVLISARKIMMPIMIWKLLHGNGIRRV